MTGYLLDTNIALIALKDPDLLTPTALEAVLAGPNVLSVASYWEVLLKAVKGRLHVGDPRSWWERAMEDLVATPLAIQPLHLAEIYNLPPHHWDPFDRILVAQATVEGLSLVTTDGTLPRYGWERLAVVV